MTLDFPATKALTYKPLPQRTDKQPTSGRTWHMDEKGVGHTLEAMEHKQIDRILEGIDSDIKQLVDSDLENVKRFLKEKNSFTRFFGKYIFPWGESSYKETLQQQYAQNIQNPELLLIWKDQPEKQKQLLSLLATQSDSKTLRELSWALKSDAIALKKSYRNQPDVVNAITGLKHKIKANQKLTAETMTASYVIPVGIQVNLSTEKVLEASRISKNLDPQTLAFKALLNLPQILPTHLPPGHPYLKGATAINLLTDQPLKAFVHSPEVEQLWQSFPTQAPTPQQEQAFLNRAIALVNQQFEPSEVWTPEERQRYIETLIEYVGNLKPPITPLGELMVNKTGLCLQRAALAKVLLDHHPPDRPLQTSFQSGYFKQNYQQEDAKFEDNPAAHAWNMVTFPSGRKYLFDSALKVVILDSTLNAQGQKYKVQNTSPLLQKVRNAYLSFPALIKHGNPDLKPPIISPQASSSAS